MGINDITIDGVSLLNMHAYPVRAENEVVSISGIFDMPKRLGRTEYNWGTSIEPYVDAEDIVLDGRNLRISLITDIGQRDKIEEMLQNCKSVSCVYGTYRVMMKDAATWKYLGDGWGRLDADLWEPVVSIPKLTKVASMTGTNNIGGYDLHRDFGMFPEIINEIAIPRRIEVNTTADYLHTEYRDAYDIDIKGYFIGNSIAEIARNISQFHALACSKGTKQLKYPQNGTAEIYFRTGMSCRAISNEAIEFKLKARAV